MSKLKVLAVDDSAVMRRFLVDALSADASIEVTTAANGRFALAKLDQLKPDLVTLDVEMPEMDGLGALRAIRKTHPKLPVIMFSSVTVRGATATLDALAAGANDYVAKPAGMNAADQTTAYIREQLLPRIKVLSGRAAQPSLAIAKPTARANLTLPAALMGPVDIVAIGVSTGGPNALSTMLPQLPADLSVPIVIVQHMPPVFTKMLADRLAAQCKFPVVEAAAGMALLPGHGYLAPGGFHLLLERRGTKVMTVLNEEVPENSCRPAVDVLFRSVASVFGRRALAVVMTGMGSDGLRGCEHLQKTGAQIIVQDEATSVVWGMPGFVARAGLAEKQLPLDRIANEISQRTSIGRRHAA